MKFLREWISGERVRIT